jgi:hypothetical protein
MLNTFKKSIPFVLAGFAVASCNTPGTSTTPDNVADEKASIFGTVTKEDGSPATNATVVLIQKVSEKDSDLGIVRTDGKGLYVFNKVPKGNYRVAFVIQTEADRKAGVPQQYDPAGKTGQYYGFITTKSFAYEGETASSFQVPAFNVGWSAGLKPHKETVSSAGPVNFSWSAAKGAKEYNVFVKDSNDNKVFQSPNSSATSFSWTNPNLEKGKDYQYIVNVIFNEPGEGPQIANGGSANGIFTAN